MSLYPTLNVTEGKILDSNVEIFCSFCNEPFVSAGAMRDHLVSCGNKTEQCPNCRKLVRRAIFTYHYENDCVADPDAPNNSSTIPPKQQRSNGIRVTVKCSFCNQNYDKDDLKNHKKICTRAPNNNAHAQLDDKFNINADPSTSANGLDDNTFIPCEYCNEGIPWHRYQIHTRACQDKEYDRMVARVRPTSPSAPPSNSDGHSRVCKFCRKLLSLTSFDFHQSVCVHNPRRNGNT